MFGKSDLVPQAIFERAKCLSLAKDVQRRHQRTAPLFQNDPLKNARIAPMALLQQATLYRSQNKAAEAVTVLDQCRKITRRRCSTTRSPRRLGAAVAISSRRRAARVRQAAEARAVSISSCSNRRIVPKRPSRRCGRPVSQGRRPDESCRTAEKLAAPTSSRRRAAAAKNARGRHERFAEAVKFLATQAGAVEGETADRGLRPHVVRGGVGMPRPRRAGNPDRTQQDDRRTMAEDARRHGEEHAARPKAAVRAHARRAAVGGAVAARGAACPHVLSTP